MIWRKNCSKNILIVPARWRENKVNTPKDVVNAKLKLGKQYQNILTML